MADEIVVNATNGQSTEANASDAKSTEVDYEVLYQQAKKEAELKAKEAADFRKGYEKYKKIAKDNLGDTSSDDDGDQLSVAELVQREVSRALTDSQAEKARITAEEIALKALRENKELKKSLANRPPSMSSQITSQEVAEIHDASISPEKERALMERFTGDDATKKRKLAEWKRNRFAKG